MTHDNPNGYIRVTGELTKEQADTLREAFASNARSNMPILVKKSHEWYKSTSEWQINKLGRSLQRQIAWLIVDMECLKQATGTLADAAREADASLKNLLKAYREVHPDE